MNILSSTVNAFTAVSECKNSVFYRLDISSTKMRYLSLIAFVACVCQVASQPGPPPPEKCAKQKGLNPVPCPGGGSPKPGQADGSVKPSHEHVVIEPCKWYIHRFDCVTYKPKTKLPYGILIDEIFVLGDHKLIIKKFFCSIDGKAPEECVAYELDSSAWPPIILKQTKFEKFVISGKGQLKFKIVTKDCNECKKWPNYECMKKEDCRKKDGMYIPNHGCPTGEVCCRKPTCSGIGKECIDEEKCPTTVTFGPCGDKENCCISCKSLGPNFTCEEEKTCKKNGKPTKRPYPCPNAKHVCCFRH